ncbi:MAG: hypothetical protein IJ494_05465 [Bacteroides sp.]|nr:hypothetical protein [Bacteroides sp.]
MKYFKYILASLLTLFMFSACSDDSVDNPTFANDEMPVIHMDWAGTYVYKMGDVVKFTAQVSPADGATFRWLVNENVVSETTSIEYTIPDAEPFTLRFEVERNGIKNFRTAQVTVTKDFEAKPYDRAVLGVLTKNGNIDQIQWDYITHLMYTSLTVSDATGELVLPDAAALNKLKTAVSLAHNNGVYVIVDITGSITFPAGTGVYNETYFNDVATDPTLRAKLIANIKNFVDEYELDGVNFYINNLNNDAGTLKNHDELVNFINELRTTFPAEREAPFNHFFLTASVPQAWNNYEFYFLGRAAESLDWVNFLLFGGTDLTPVPHAPDWQVADNIARFRDSAGIPAEKMMIGIGAFGVKYDIPAGTSPTWGTLDQYLSYPLYNEIVKMDADAASKSQLTQGNATLYYVGATGADTSVASKAATAKEYGVKGMLIWALDYDTSDPATSLTQAIYHQMNSGE